MDRNWIWFADNGNIRKWSTEPFDEGTEYRALASLKAEPWARDDLAVGLAMLDGITLHEIKSTVGDPADANNWRNYLGRADDLLAHLSVRCSDRQVTEYLEEGLGILNSLIDNIKRHGNYSPESTCVFIDQAGGSIRAALASIAPQGGEGVE